MITGTAGFIGFHLARRLLEAGHSVVGLDCLDDYYDVTLKKDRHAQLAGDNFTPVIGRIEEPGLLHALFEEHRPEIVVHLAAQAGVRYSIDNPRAYFESNLLGSFEVLEAAKSFPPEHLLIASSSSAFGANTQMPYFENDRADHQLSFYGATKKSTENMAHAYAHIHNLPVTLFRFFTVYGPWGRPDMAPFKFTKAILEGRAIDVYNYGEMHRDFTYIDDLVEAIQRLIPAIPAQKDRVEGDSLSPVAPYRLVNIGNSKSIPLTEFIAAIEAATGRAAQRNLLPMQQGDVVATWADTTLLTALTGFAPNTDIQSGVAEFIDWYRLYYAIKDT